MKKSKYKQNENFIPENKSKYKGTYPIYLRSGWEIKFAKWCDLNPAVLEYTSESIYINYYNITKQRMARYFPDFINYENNIIDKEGKTIDGDPYINISEKDWKKYRDKSMIVKDGKYQELIKSDDELLSQAKKNKYYEISLLRDQKIIKDSVRYSEAQAAKAAIEALNSIEDISNYDITQYFS